MRNLLLVLITISFLVSCDYLGDRANEIFEYRDPPYPTPVKLVASAFQYGNSNSIGGYFYLIPEDSKNRLYETTRAKGVAWCEVRQVDNTLPDKKILVSVQNKIRPNDFTVIRRPSYSTYSTDTINEAVIIHQIIDLEKHRKTLSIENGKGKLDVIFYFKLKNGMILYDYIQDVSFGIKEENQLKKEKEKDQEKTTKDPSKMTAQELLEELGLETKEKYHEKEQSASDLEK